MHTEDLTQALESGDPDQIKEALYHAIRAKGVMQVSRESGISRRVLYQAFKPEGNPSLSTLMSVINCLGLTLTLKP